MARFMPYTFIVGDSGLRIAVTVQEQSHRK